MNVTSKTSNFLVTISIYVYAVPWATASPPQPSLGNNSTLITTKNKHYPANKHTILPLSQSQNTHLQITIPNTL